MISTLHTYEPFILNVISIILLLKLKLFKNAKKIPSMRKQNVNTALRTNLQPPFLKVHLFFLSELDRSPKGGEVEYLPGSRALVFFVD